MTEVEARAKGQALISRLRGTGWELRVFMNDGWQCSAVNRFITVNEHNGKYSALLATDPDRPGVGEIFWSGNGIFDDPNEAVEVQMKVARAFLNKARRAVEHVEGKVLGLKK